MKNNKSLTIFSILLIIFLLIFSGLYYLNKSTYFLTFLMLSPAVSVLLTKVICKESFSDLYLKPYFKGNIKWYLSTYFLTPFIAFFGALIYFIIFPNDFNMIGSEYAKAMEIENESEYISKLTFMIPLAIILNPIAGLISCLGEELAWRAYLLPQLNKRFSIQISVILNGIIWGLWHVPIIAMGYNYGNENITIGIIAMIIFCTIIGTISSYLFYKTKSVWCSVIFHTSLNGIDKYRPSELFMSKNSNMFIGPDLLGIIGGIGFIIISIILFTRLKKENMIKGVKINAHTISRQNTPENS